MASTKLYIKQRRWKIIADKLHDEWCLDNGYPLKPRAASIKHQAQEAASSKRQASSSELQATSREQQAPRFYFRHKDTRG